ncbi:MAG: DUF5683 domain-containing protein [Rikenellaceae bacterium]|nr:DUF5683 domain-containing protein [Rikenellaceae bacterium]MCL2692130.1 DUF5683 domain-containing protein [Rikenellaceae bacterium]
MLRSSLLIAILLTATMMGTACGVIGRGTGSGSNSGGVQPPQEQRELRRYMVSGGVARETGARAMADSLMRDTTAFLATASSMLHQSDSLRQAAQRHIAEADSILRINPNFAARSDSLRVQSGVLNRRADSLYDERRRLMALMPDVAAAQEAQADTLARPPSRREVRRTEREELRGVPRYSPLFRDTLPISRMAALSFVAPGLGQVHNKQYLKLPVLYGVAGTAMWFGLQDNKCYRLARTVYDDLIYHGYTRENSDLDRVQTVMIKYNQRQQFWFGLALATHIYFVCDGVLNYPGLPQKVKIATTLSTIMPGAGQIYNGSYWKAPIVMGGFASMIMVVDWNNRGYQRFRLAYNLMTSGQIDAVEPALRRRQPSELQNIRNLYRRNRDLGIILTGAIYLINIVDAHVDAHLKDWDIGDNMFAALDFSVRPRVQEMTTTRGYARAMGVCMSVRF